MVAVATWNLEETEVGAHLLNPIAINLTADLPLSFENRASVLQTPIQTDRGVHPTYPFHTAAPFEAIYELVIW